MTSEDQPTSGYALRVAWAKQSARLQDRRVTARRADLVLRVSALTLLWLVSVSLLVGLGVADGARLGDSDPAFGLAAVAAVLVPFAAAVLATRHGEVWIGGAYVILTLVMVLPALGLLGLP